MQDLVNSPHTAYRDGLGRGVLLFQRCIECSAAVFPPRVVCPSCGGGDLAVEESSGRGTVYSTTSVSGGDRGSYAVCLVDLDEGFRMMSTVIDVPADEIEIGSRVTLVIESGETQRPTFVQGAGS